MLLTVAHPHSFHWCNSCNPLQFANIIARMLFQMILFRLANLLAEAFHESQSQLEKHANNVDYMRKLNFIPVTDNFSLGSCLLLLLHETSSSWLLFSTDKSYISFCIDTYTQLRDFLLSVLLCQTATVIGIS